MTALELTARWPAAKVAACVTSGGAMVSTTGDIDQPFAVASITKPLVAWAFLVAVEEGTIRLEDPAGQPGCTYRHLLSHAGGYPFDGTEPISPPERTRGYSNAGIEIAARSLEAATGFTMAAYLRDAVLDPLGMSSTVLAGSPAHGARSSVRDLARFVAETRSPTLISAGTRDIAFLSTYPDLSGIVPGVGRFAPCPWGLGFEIRGEKSPHWTGQRNSARTVGHFGGTGTMFWFDPDIDVALIALTDKPFGAWSMSAWPAVSDAVIAEFGAVA